MKPLYQLQHRRVGYSIFISVICTRGNISVQSSEKVLPPILEYDAEGNFTIVEARQVLKGLHTHPYKPLTKDFNEERLADLDVAGLFNQLEHFPTLPVIYEGGTATKHPIAEYIYSQMVYLKPVPELQNQLDSMSYVKRTRLLPPILEKVAKGFEDQTGTKIDLFSVPKRKVGTFAYIADKNGIAEPAKMFSFGFENIIPCDRIARELSSLKACERFINPQPIEFELPEAFKPYVSSLRVAIVGTKYSMLDSGDLYESAIPKIACRLSRKKVEKDVSEVPVGERNLVYRPFRSGVEVFHEEETQLDETIVEPGTIRLILPGGVKIAAQYTRQQLKDTKGNNVDALISFETFAKKGSLASFLFGLGIDLTTLDTTKAIEIFKTLQQEKVSVDGKDYLGYIIEIPVMRPGQRYTELSKASDEITVDLIAKAILRKDYSVRPHIETEYKNLVQLRQAIHNEIKLIDNKI